MWRYVRFSIKEAAWLLGVDEGTLRRYVDAGQLATSATTSGQDGVDGEELARFASPGSVSYPIMIGLTGTDQPLFAGQSAAVSVMLAHASSALTVPSSAVHHGNSGSTVTVLQNGTARNIDVTLGVVGPTRTQVLAGLDPGDQVILADLSRPLPTIDIQNLRRIEGGGNGRPGG